MASRLVSVSQSEQPSAENSLEGSHMPQSDSASESEMDNVAQIYPLTAAQKGLLYQTLLADTDALYRTQSRDNVFGQFDCALFRQTLQFLVQRHESLRCLFLHEGLDEPAAVVRTDAQLPWQEHDLTTMSEAGQSRFMDELALASMAEPLALNSAPLFRVTVAKLSEQLHQVIFDIHHLVFDGWSSVLFFSELQTVYAALQSDLEPALPVAGKFSDYAMMLSARDSAQLQSHWSDKLSGFEKPTALQLDTRLPADSELGRYTNASYRTALDSRATQSLNEIARTARVTMSIIVEAAWALTLARYNNTDDVVVGVTLNGRSSTLQNHERTFGMFANAMPLRLRCASRTRLYDWLDSVQKEKALLTENENASMADIHLASELPTGVDLFDALLVFQTFPNLGGTEQPPIAFSNHSVHENSPLPLIIDIFHGEQIQFLAMYIKERFSETALQQLVGHFLNILQSMADLKHPQQACLVDIDMLSDSDRDLLLNQWNQAVGNKPRSDTIQSVFLEQVARTPDAIAVRDDHQAMTYQELADVAWGVSRFLRREGVKSGEAVAVSLERSALMYPAILGTLLADALFVPVDPSYPAGRQNHMLADCKTRYVLTSSQTKTVFDAASLRVVELDTEWDSIIAANADNFPRSARAHDGAYIMYTSGSTGLAKGVIGSHGATLNRFEWMWKDYPFSTGEVCCQKTSLSFVDSIWELMGPLLKGTPSRVLSDDVVKNVHRFVDVLEHEKITRVVLLPSYLSILLDSVDNLATHLSALRVCVVSGEPLTRNVARQFVDTMPHCQLLNLYGSTEVSGDATAALIGSDDITENVPVGRPISNCQVYILDTAHALMPPGAVGEIGIAGRGLSLGYLGESDGLNKDKFIDNPFGEDRLYLTGDKGRFLPDGVIEHHGRKDVQLKIRGYRIEPAEVERAIASYQGVRSVLVNAPGNNKLHAYYLVKQGATVDSAALEEHVQTRLPEYMVPQVLLKIDAFPRLPNGKISRKDLPDPTISVARQRVAPRTETEKNIAQIWQKVLGTNDVSVYDNFVASGGSSLSGMRFNARVFREFGTTVLPRMLLTANLAQVAAHIRPDDVVENDVIKLNVDLMEPLYFGAEGRRLFGVLHVPDSAPKPRAVLLCSSIGHEYMRLHRSYQMLAIELARSGYHVLRFDFYGVGDSQGESSDATMRHWEQDVQAAAQLLQDKSGAEKISVVGVRLGAPIILGARLENVDKTILWDPVCSGVHYLTHLDHLHRYAMKNLDRFRFRQYKSGKWERFGYTYSRELAEQVEAVQISQLIGKQSKGLCVVTTKDVVSTNNMDVQSLLSVDNVRHETVRDVWLWFDYDQASYLAFVQPVINRISAIIKE